MLSMAAHLDDTNETDRKSYGDRKKKHVNRITLNLLESCVQSQTYYISSGLRLSSIKPKL